MNKVKISADAMKSFVKKAGYVFKQKSSIPLHVTVDGKKHSISILTSDVKITSYYSAECYGIDADGTMVMDRKSFEKLAKFAKGFGSLEKENNEVKFSGKRTCSVFDENADLISDVFNQEYKLVMEMPGNKFIDIISKVDTNRSLKDIRPAIMGIHFTNKFIEATDSFRLIRYNFPEELFVSDSFDFIAPFFFKEVISKFVGKRNEEYVQIENSKNSIRVSGIDNDGIRFSIDFLKIHGRYPNLESIIPTYFEEITKVNANTMLEFLDGYENLKSCDLGAIVTFRSYDNYLNLFGRDDEININTETEYTYKGEDRNLSVKFVKDALKIAGKNDVELKFPHGSLKPVLAEFDSYQMIIVPIRSL